MKKLFSTIVIFALSFAIGTAQTVGSVETKDFGYAQKKFKNAQKRIYISQFRVIYQLMIDWSETAQGGRTLGGGVRGDATARLALAVKGVSEADLQEMTDKLYQDYLAQLVAGGYEIVTADEASKIEFHQEFERKSGGGLSLAQFPGYIMSVPTGYDYFVKRTDNKGRERKTFLDETPRISVELDGAVIAKVNLVVQFAKEAESAGSKMLGKAIGGVAKVVAETDYRLDKDGVIGGGGMVGDIAYTSALYTYATRKMAPDANCNFRLKNTVPISGVFDDKKYKAVETAQSDVWGADYGAIRVFSADNTFYQNLQAIEVDAAKYKAGFMEAAETFMKSSTTEFLSYSE